MDSKFTIFTWGNTEMRKKSLSLKIMKDLHNLIGELTCELFCNLVTFNFSQGGISNIDGKNC